MYTLTSWLMRAKRAPWKTSAVGQSWRESRQRYLQIAPWLQCPALFVVMSLTKSPPQANEDDSLMQLFGPNILKEFLVMRRLPAVVMLSFSFPPNTAQERVSCRFGKSRVVREGLRDSGECDKAALPTHLCHECTKIMSPIREPDLRSVASLFDRGRWISWGHAARKFKGSYSCTLLMVYWGCLEVPCLNLYSASLCFFLFPGRLMCPINNESGGCQPFWGHRWGEADQRVGRTIRQGRRSVYQSHLPEI